MAKKRITPKSQYAAMHEWKKQNMKSVSCMYRKEFVEEFKEACTKLGIAQSDVLRKAMTDTINLANEKVDK